jgi:hypothetical protein
MHLNQCVFCGRGVTDDAGCRCGAIEALGDPRTPFRERQAIEKECGNARERFEARMHAPPLRPEMTASA